MKKHSFFITNEAIKYWKKEVKNGRIQIAAQGDKIYVVNSYNAFVFPNIPVLYAELVQPATLRPAPADGDAQIWRNGEYHEDNARETVDVVERILTSDAPSATRTRFAIETKEGAFCRLLKLHNGDLAAVNKRYDDMLDYSFRYAVRMASAKAPAVYTSDDCTAILMPVNMPGLLDCVRSLGEVTA